MVEQEIARPIAQHLVQRRPRRRRVERRVEQLLDPCGIQVFRRAIPGIAQGPDAAIRRARPRRLVGAHGDLARDRAALGRRAVARERRVPRPRGRRRDLGEPEIRRPAVPLTRFGRDAVHRARSAKARPRAASPRRRRRAKARPSTARSARAGPRARPRLRRCRSDLAPVSPLPRTGRRKMLPRSATMLSQQRQAGVLETIEPPSLAPIEHYCQKLWLNHGRIRARSMQNPWPREFDGGPLPSSSAPAPPLVPGKGRSVACGHRRRRGSTPRDAEASSRARRAITFTSGHRP